MVIAIFFGSAFVPATPVARVLTVASILLSVNRVTSAGLRAFNRPFRAGAGDLIAAGATVGSLMVLVPRIGLMGAAIATSAAYCANFVFNYWSCQRLGISARELLLPNSADVKWVRSAVRQRATAAWRI
jgi:O-antigen/teichoic acid export membrane protein